ncbi:MAG: hypothetical protein ACLTSZ_13440 [Lachnospiraceae bacterium]
MIRLGCAFIRACILYVYQFNPASQKWGDAHWGHVTSTDLPHWH